MKKSARLATLAFLFSILAQAAFGQWVNNVSISPTPAYSINPIYASIQGEMGTPCTYVNNSWTTVQGNNVNVYLDFETSPGICIQIVVPFTHGVTIGLLAAGTYTLRVYNADSGLVVYTTQFTVYGPNNGSCLPPSPAQLFASNVTFTSARLNSALISGVTQYQFRHRRLNTSGWTTLVASSQNYRDAGGLFSNSAYEFQCRVLCNGTWTDYSASQYFTTTPTGNNCNNPVDLICGSNYSGSNSAGSYNYTKYTSNGLTVVNDMTGPEAFHRFTLYATSNVTVNMNGLNYDLDLLFAGSCNNTSIIKYSINSGTSSEQVSLNNLSPGTYTIIVDGWNGAVSNYNLSVQCTPTVACSAPTTGQVSVSNLTSTSVRLNCSLSAQRYAWAYRLPGGSWISLPTTTQNYYDLSGLQPGTTYEYIVAVLCSNNSWSAWSPTRQFTTPNPVTGSTCSNPIIAACGGTYFGNNGNGGSNFNQYYYQGNWIAEIGPEMIYRITLPVSGPLNISLTGLSADLDLFLINNCNPGSVVAASGNQNSNSEFINVSYLQAGTYQIVVEGWGGYTSNYVLSVMCSGGTFIGNDEHCNAVELSNNSGCNPISGTNVGATTSSYPNLPTECNTTNMKDVWYKVQVPYTGKVMVSTFPGTMTDAVIAVYHGSCYNLSPGTPTYCFDWNPGNGDEMPDVTLSGAPGTWWYIRVWGYGGTTGTFSICAQTVNNLVDNENSVHTGIATEDRSDNTLADAATRKASSAEQLKLTLFPIPTKDVLTCSLELFEESDVHIRIFDLTGNLVRETAHHQTAAGIFTERFDVADLSAGLYVVQVAVGEQELRSKFVKQ